MKKSRKINARITPQIDQKLREIVSATKSSMSEVIMQAIELYYAQGAAYSNTTPYEIAKASGLIGCFSKGTDLSVNYKKYLTQSLEKKYADR